MNEQVQNLTTITNVTSDAENNEHTFYESPPLQPPFSSIKKQTSTSNELRNVPNDSSVGTLMSLESENDYLNNVNSNDNSIQTRNTLIIGDIIDFNFFNNNNEVNENDTNINNLPIKMIKLNQLKPRERPNHF
ncbi:11358_t:CDS:2 [Entrophospora sp. SA101]|nr:11358_t:CDS:2 [Entrophospora sp. SA101]